MAIILPSSHSTYGDATSTRRRGLERQYVLAIFSSDADLGWLVQLRTALGCDEVKHGALVERRTSLQAIPELWTKIERGIAGATIFVTDPAPILSAIRKDLTAQGAVEGVDFDCSLLVKSCVEALVRSTPVADLPKDLVRLLQPLGFRALPNPLALAPATIATRLHNRLKAASVFSARAYAMFDVAMPRHAVTRRTRELTPERRGVVFAKLLETQRVFDDEHAPSVALLNDASDTIGDVLVRTSSSWSIEAQPLVVERNSSALDHLQAADVAAGWARDILDRADINQVALTFGRVLLNGELVVPNHT